MHVRTYYVRTCMHACMCAHRQAGRQAGRHAGRQTDRQTDMHTYMLAVLHTCRNACMHADTHTHTHTKSNAARHMHAPRHTVLPTPAWVHVCTHDLCTHVGTQLATNLHLKACLMYCYVGNHGHQTLISVACFHLSCENVEYSSLSCLHVYSERPREQRATQGERERERDIAVLLYVSTGISPCLSVSSSCSSDGG